MYGCRTAAEPAARDTAQSNGIQADRMPYATIATPLEVSVVCCLRPLSSTDCQPKIVKDVALTDLKEWLKMYCLGRYDLPCM